MFHDIDGGSNGFIDPVRPLLHLRLRLRLRLSLSLAACFSTPAHPLVISGCPALKICWVSGGDHGCVGRDRSGDGLDGRYNGRQQDGHGADSTARLTQPMPADQRAAGAPVLQHRMQQYHRTFLLHSPLAIGETVILLMLSLQPY